MTSFFQELRRRNVVRVGIAYVVTCWLLIQVLDLVLDAAAAPDWVMRVFMLGFALCLPPVLIFAWAFELTPDGIKREHEVNREQQAGSSSTSNTSNTSSNASSNASKRLDYVTIGMLILVVIAVFYKDTLMSTSNTSANETIVETDQPANDAGEQISLAVLAFENMSSDVDQGYFADGLSEELLNKLANVPQLKVAGRTSSFAFKGQNRDLREIGELLSVAYILEGSVRKSQDQIRVTAQLIEAKDGFHLFSDTYDGNLSDIFAVQDAIAERITDSLLLTLTGGKIQATKATSSEVYALYLRAREMIRTRNTEQMRQADAMLERAIELDPNYAPARAQKSLAVLLLSDAPGSYGVAPATVAYPIAKRLIAEALALDPLLAEAHAINGVLLLSQRDAEQARTSLERAVSINPSSSQAATWLSNVTAQIGDLRETIRILEAVVERDPLFGVAFSNLVWHYSRADRLDEASRVISRVSGIVGSNTNVWYARGIVSMMSGDVADAVLAFRRVYRLQPERGVNTRWLGYGLLALADYATISEVGLPEHQILGLASLGRSKEVEQLISALRVSTSDTARQLGHICDAFLRVNSSQGCIDYFERSFGSPQQIFKAAPVAAAWHAEYLGFLAQAYRATGDTEKFRFVRDHMQKTLIIQGERGMTSFMRDVSLMQLAALQNDTEAVIKYFRSATDRGWLPEPGLETSWELASVVQNPDVQKILRKVSQRRALERSKAGL
ncbi:MAG: tetratricopeptide repeat protein [Congregibacter sp.]